MVGETLSFSREMQALEARHGGRLGLALSTSGRRFAYRPDERFGYCSTFKMYLAAATLLRVQAGEERLDRAIPVTQADMVNHAPVTEPAVGASTCASGSHVCTGNIGIFTAKEAKKASQSHVWAFAVNGCAMSSGIEDAPAVKIIHTIATSIKSDPRSV